MYLQNPTTIITIQDCVFRSAPKPSLSQTEKS